MSEQFVQLQNPVSEAWVKISVNTGRIIAEQASIWDGVPIAAIQRPEKLNHTVGKILNDRLYGLTMKVADYRRRRGELAIELAAVEVTITALETEIAAIECPMADAQH